MKKENETLTPATKDDYKFLYDVGTISLDEYHLCLRGKIQLIHEKVEIIRKRLEKERRLIKRFGYEKAYEKMQKNPDAL